MSRARALVLCALVVACSDDAGERTTNDLTTGAGPGTSSGDAPTTGTTGITDTPTTGTPNPTTDATTGTASTGSSGPGVDDTTAADPTTGADPTTTTDATTTGDTTTGEAPPDPCSEVEPTCPGAPPKSGGGGLVEIDRCGFPMADVDSWAAQTARVDALKQTLPAIALRDLPLAEFNRAAVPLASVPGNVKDVVQAFRWDDEDNDKETWIPQGLTGSPDAVVEGTFDGRKLVLVSWYHDTKGVRVSVADVTDPAKPRYRHILLVEPIDGDPVNFKPIIIHAGGMAWVGDLLYVVHTGKGFRVFDTRALLRVPTEVDSIGWDATDKKYYAGLYKYVLPQVGAYTHKSPCTPIFSSVALDRTSDPPSLISSEYCNGSTACAETYSGRLFRWPLDPASGRLAAPEVWPLAAYYMAQSHVQGGIAVDGDFFLSSSAPASQAGVLYALPQGGASQNVTWVDTPEDLMRDGDLLWSLSEGTGIRVVFAVPLAKLPG
jgi:hypothetical protein